MSRGKHHHKCGNDCDNSIRQQMGPKERPAHHKAYSRRNKHYRHDINKIFARILYPGKLDDAAEQSPKKQQQSVNAGRYRQGQQIMKKLAQKRKQGYNCKLFKIFHGTSQIYCITKNIYTKTKLKTMEKKLQKKMLQDQDTQNIKPDLPSTLVLPKMEICFNLKTQNPMIGW